MSIKKICLVVLSLGPGGTERVMSELAGYFALKYDVQTHLIIYSIKRDVFYEVPPSVVIHKPDFEFDNSKRFLSILKTLRFLRETVKSIQPDSVLSFGEYYNSFVLLALFGLKFPIYISDRGQPGKSLRKFHDILRRWLYPKATGVIAQTAQAKQILLKQFPRSNIKVIGNPIRKIDFVKEECERENIVLAVGRLIASKHHDLLIDIFLKINVPNWKLVIVGGDAQKQQVMEQLTEKIEKLKVADKVILSGNLSNVDDYYRKSKIFVSASSSEGFPNAIGEAMSAGLAVVAFDCPAGPADMIEDGVNGFLVPLWDMETFEDKLRIQMQEERLRNKMGKAARQSIERFFIQSTGEQFYNFIMNSR